MKNYRIEVHALKSVAETVGALLLSKLARIIESAAANEEEDKVMILHSVLIEEIEKHRERLSEFFEETLVEEKELDSNTVNMYLQMMKAGLINKEYNVADYLLGEISVYKYPEEIRKDIEKLKEYVTELMWDEAVEMINTISYNLNSI